MNISDVDNCHFLFEMLQSGAEVLPESIRVELWFGIPNAVFNQCYVPVFFLFVCSTIYFLGVLGPPDMTIYVGLGYVSAVWGNC